MAVSFQKYVTPEAFGAVANGSTDDTNAIRDCISYANDNKIEVKFTKGRSYKVNQNSSIVAKCSIDFNGATIILSGGSTEPFIKVQPDSFSTTNLTQSNLTNYKVNSTSLYNKCLTIVTPISLGKRDGSGSNMNYIQTIKTDMNGNFISGPLECEIISGTYQIKNAHDYMVQKLVFKNAIIDYSKVGNDNIAIFIDCYRSNVKVDNINITGNMNISSWSYHVLGFYNCSNIEISNIWGNSPYSNPNSSGSASGYIVGLYEVIDVYMHDCDFGGSTTQWGCIGISYISNFLAERVNTNRFDCHYYYTGYFTVRDSITNRAIFCGGNGEMVYERVSFVTSGTNHLIERREDLNLMPNGVIKFDHCTFMGEGSGSTYGVALVWRIAVSPDSTLLSRIKYDFTHFIFDSCKILTTNKALTTFDMASGWDQVMIDIINTNAGERTLYNYGVSYINRGIIKGCNFSNAITVGKCKELTIKDCSGDTGTIQNTVNCCKLYNNIFTPTKTTLVQAANSIISGNIILADESLSITSGTKFVVANNNFNGTNSTNATSWGNRTS